MVDVPGDPGDVDDRVPVAGLTKGLMGKMDRNIHDQLKNIRQIEQTRHRSITNFMVILVAGFIAYTHRPKKPSLNLPPTQENQLILVWKSPKAYPELTLNRTEEYISVREERYVYFFCYPASRTVTPSVERWA